LTVPVTSRMFCAPWSFGVFASGFHLRDQGIEFGIDGLGIGEHRHAHLEARAGVVPGGRLGTVVQPRRRDVGMGPHHQYLRQRIALQAWIYQTL
jgi:hypothetical protein